MGDEGHSAHSTGPKRKKDLSEGKKNINQEMTEEELEEVTGRVYQIKTCKHCHRVAVAGMEVCAVCFRRYYNDNSNQMKFDL